MCDQVLPGNFVVDYVVEVAIPEGLAAEHGLKSGPFLAKFCRPLTNCAIHSEWPTRWAQLTNAVAAHPLGFMGMVLLWQYRLMTVPKGHYLTHDSGDFSSLCHMCCITGRKVPVVTFEQRIDLAILPASHQFICFCPQV
jgi:hypothetical protein